MQLLCICFSCSVQPSGLCVLWQHNCNGTSGPLLHSCMSSFMQRSMQSCNVRFRHASRRVVHIDSAVHWCGNQWPHVTHISYCAPEACVPYSQRVSFKTFIVDCMAVNFVRPVNLIISLLNPYWYFFNAHISFIPTSYLQRNYAMSMAYFCNERQFCKLILGQSKGFKNIIRSYITNST